MVVDNPNILVLARKLEQIPNIIQVRFFAPVLPNGIKAAGPGGMNFACVTQDFRDTEKIHIFQSLIPVSVINNEEYHQSVIDNATLLVNHYFQTGEFPHGTQWSEKALFHVENINDFVQTPPEEPGQNS